MGYRGKIAEQNRARDLRAESWTLQDIADELGVAKSSVSLWVRDVDFEPSPRRKARKRGPNALQRRKAAEIEQMNRRGLAELGVLDVQAFLAAGVALYAGDGSKTGGEVRFANSNPTLIAFHCRWLREFFEIDESRMRVRLYLHEGLDLDAANAHWSSVTGIPVSQFGRPYRAAADPTIRTAKYQYGCCHVGYCCTRTHRRIMGLIRALVESSVALPG